MKRYLLIAILSVCYSMGTQAQKRIISSWEELIDVKHKQDSSYFPKLLRDEALQNKLSEKVSFPELAKRKKLTETVKLQLSIDTQGKIKGMEIKSEPNQLFDTSAIRLAMATSGHWKPAIRKGIATEVDITTQIRFSILRSGSQKMKYAVSMLGLPSFIVDSTANSPACLLLTNEDNDTTYYLNSKGEDASKVLLAQTYGTVTVGFDIDTLGRLSEIAIVNSVSSELDENALQFIRSTEGKWLPAIKDGSKRESHVEFDIYYYLYTKSLKGDYSYLTHVFDRKEAQELFDKKDFKRALTKINKVCKYYIHDPEMFLLRGFCHVNLEDLPNACNDLSYALFLAEDYGYPKVMSKEKVTEFVNKYCNLNEMEENK